METVARMPEPVPPPAPEPPRRVRGAFLVAAVLLAALLAGALAMGTEGGQAWLGARLGELVTRSIAGELRVRSAAVRLDGLHLAGVEVRGPDGERVLDIERVEATPLLGPGLVKLHLHVLSLDLVRPRVLVESPPGGGDSSLEAAFAPRKPSASGDDGGSTAFRVEVDRLRIEDGALVIREAGAEPTVALRGLAVELHVVATQEGAQVRGSLAAALSAPLAGDTAVSLDAAIDGDYRHLRLRALEARQGGARVALTGEVDFTTLEGELASLAVDLPSADAERLVPSWRPGSDLHVAGAGSYRGGKATAKLTLGPKGEAQDGQASRSDGAGDVEIEGELDLARQPAAWLVRASGTAVALRSFDATLPPAVLGFTAIVEGRDLPPRFARFEADVETVELGGVTLGPVSARGTLDEAAEPEGRSQTKGPLSAPKGGSANRPGPGRGDSWTGLVLEELRVRVPGASASADGKIAADGKAALRFDLSVHDAAAVRRALARAGAAAGIALELPEIAGEARFSGRLDGPLQSPRFAGRLRSTRLEVAGIRTEALAGDVSLRGLPDRPEGTLDGTVAKLAAGGAELSDLRLDLRLDAARIDGTVGAKGRFGRIDAALGARISKTRDTLHLDRLRLTWPGADWSLEQPATIRLEPRLAVDGFALSGATGRVEASGSYGPGEAFAARIRASEVDLAALPRELVPESLSKNFSFRQDRGAEPEGRSQQNQGLLREARVGNPARPPAGPGIPTGLAAGLAGKVDLDADLSGTVKRPRGRLDARIAGGAVTGIEGLSATLAATFDGRDARGALEASHETTRLAVTFAMPVDGAGPIDVKARFEGLDAARTAKLAGLDTGLIGTVEGEAVVVGTLARPEATLRLAGTGFGLDGIAIAEVTLDANAAGLEKPRGSGRLLVRGLRVDGRPPVDADLDLEAGADKTTLALVTRFGEVELVTVSLAAAAPAEELAGAWELVALEGRVGAASVDAGLLSRLLGLDVQAGGNVTLDTVLGGTVAAPELRLSLRGDELRFDRNALGRFAVEGIYAGKALAVEAAVEGASGGNLRLAGKWTADLGLAGLQEGALASLADAPLDLAFVANRFDLAFLARLHPDVRQLEGILDADLRIRGKVPTPDIAGTLALDGGRLGYTNLGDLQNLSLAVVFEPDRFTLKRLTASSTGTFEAAGAAVRRTPGGPYELDVTLVARNFGVIASDVTRAYLDLDGRLTGEMVGPKLDGVLELTKGQVTLPNTPSKSIQALADHPDFVVAHRGENREAARARAAREAAPKVRTPSAWDAAEASIHVKTRRPLPVQGVDVSIRAAIDLRVHVTRAAFTLAGNVQAADGHLVVMNRRFEVERGRVVYGGREAPGNPRLDVVAAHPSSYAKVTVHVGGNVEEPVLALRSEPAMSEAEIATLLATGRPQLKRGGGGVSEASGAASAIGALMSDQLKKGIASKLPVDVINFQAGEEDVFEGSTLEAGSYVTDRIYVGYQRRFTEEDDPRRNQNEVRVEYQLAPRWTLESSYGDNAVGGVDLFWTRDF